MWNKNIEEAVRNLKNTILKELSSFLLKETNGRKEFKKPFEISPGEYVVNVHYYLGRIIVGIDSDDIPEENDLELYSTDEMVKIAQKVFEIQ